MNIANQLILDTLKEVGTSGMGHAAKGLSLLLNHRVEITPPKVKQLLLEEVTDYLGSAEQVTCGVFSRLEGDLSGTVLIIYPGDTPLMLLETWLGKQPKSLNALEELETSALTEMSNICLGGYLTALNQLTGYTIMCTPPALAIDMLGALIQEMLISLAEQTDEVSLIDTEFSIKNKKIKGFFLLSFDPSSQEKLLNRLGLSKD
ncbi:chemotaxis protein CheC [Legionella impletisoli]|uniref:Chemotaxis protein CheC n=1 Tax=Legionella impletisoli TaxID=343510 RepID=A0A917N8P5_9GAMM|nr:chemotaxis protein CheC [Legionella impletisoli]GGI78216.1 chemotaxis protein CheC [Legionella impletisoli]